MKFHIFSLIWAILLLTPNFSSQTPVCHCNISNNVIGGKKTNYQVGQMLQFQHLFRVFFCCHKWHHVPCIWHHLSSLPHQFSISEDVGGWQPWYRMNKTISKLYKISTYQSIEGNIELLELPQVNNRPWNVLQLITTQTEPLQICEVKQLDRNAVYAWLSLQRKNSLVENNIYYYYYLL